METINNKKLENLFNEFCSEIGFKEISLPVAVATLDECKVLDTPFKLKVDYKSMLSEFIRYADFKIVEGKFGSRCLLNLKTSIKKQFFCNLYDEDYDRSFTAGDISEEDKERLVIAIYKDSSVTKPRVFLFSKKPANLEEAMKQLNIE